MAERGETSARAAEMAALDTRQAKDYGVSVERLEAEWAARAAELGFGAREIDSLPVPGLGARARTPRGRARCFDELAVPAGAHQPTIRASAAARSFGRSPSAPARWGPARSASWPTASSPSRPRGAARARSGASPRRAIPRPSCWRPSASCSRARSSARPRAPAWWTSRIARVGARRPPRAVGRAGGDGARPDRLRRRRCRWCWGGPARARPMPCEPARAAWEAEGHQVIGAALSARAAQELAGRLRDPLPDPGAPADRRTRPRRARPLHAMSVVVLDEAGMVGTRDLAELARHAEDAGPSWCWSATTPSCQRSPPGSRSGPWPRRLGALELRREPTPGARLGARGPGGDPAGPGRRGGGGLCGPRAHPRGRGPRWGPAGTGGRLAGRPQCRPRGPDDRRQPSMRPRRCRARPRALLVEAGEVGGPARDLPRWSGQRRRPGDDAAKRRQPRGAERHAGDGARSRPRRRPAGGQRRRRHRRASAQLP